MTEAAQQAAEPRGRTWACNIIQSAGWLRRLGQGARKGQNGSLYYFGRELSGVNYSALPTGGHWAGHQPSDLGVLTASQMKYFTETKKARDDKASKEALSVVIPFHGNSQKHACCKCVCTDVHIQIRDSDVLSTCT